MNKGRYVFSQLCDFLPTDHFKWLKQHLRIKEFYGTSENVNGRTMKMPTGFMDVLEQKAKYLPFIKKGQEVHLVLFLKESPTHCAKGMRVFLPSDVMKA